MAGHTGLTPDFLEKTRLIQIDKFESVREVERRVVYVFPTKEELLSREDLIGELVVSLDNPERIELVTGFDGTCQLKLFRKLRKPINLLVEEKQDGDDN